MAIVKQHRHYWPGWKNPEELGWHDASVVHAKYPTAHEHIHSEREVERAVKPKAAKEVDPLYASPPEYGPSASSELFKEILEEAEAVVAKSKNLPRSAKV